MNLVDNLNYENIVFIDMDLKKQVDAIDKFVTSLYKPDLIHIEEVSDNKGNIYGYKIIFYFDKISDEYILNPRAHDIKGHKSEILRREIRERVQDYFDIKTSGVQPPDFFAPWELHPINIIVTHTN